MRACCGALHTTHRYMREPRQHRLPRPQRPHSRLSLSICVARVSLCLPLCRCRSGTTTFGRERAFCACFLCASASPTTTRQTCATKSSACSTKRVYVAVSVRASVCLHLCAPVPACAYAGEVAGLCVPWPAHPAMLCLLLTRPTHTCMHTADPVHSGGEQGRLGGEPPSAKRRGYAARQRMELSLRRDIGQDQVRTHPALGG
jgi:hypothetical protein